MVLTNETQAVYNIDSGDLDNNGYFDLVVVSYNDDRVTVIRNYAAGFAECEVVPTSTTPYASRVVDLDGDGVLDILVNHELAQETIIIWAPCPLPLATCDYSTRTVLATNFTPIFSAIADYDNDNILDIATVYRVGSQVVIQYGLGSRAYGAPIILANSLMLTFCIQAARLDDNNTTDIVISTYGDGTMSVLLNDGASRTWATRQVVSTANPTSYWVSARDLDNDGDVDLVSGSETMSAVTAFFNDGVGGFARTKLVAALQGTYWIGLSNVFTAGNVDVIIASYALNGMYVCATTPMCDNLPSVNNAIAPPGDVDMGVTVSYVSCARGYVPVSGSMTRTCRANTTYSGSPLACVINPLCPSVPSLAYMLPYDLVVAGAASARILLKTFLADGTPITCAERLLLYIGAPDSIPSSLSSSSVSISSGVATIPGGSLVIFEPPTSTGAVELTLLMDGVPLAQSLVVNVVSTFPAAGSFVVTGAALTPEGDRALTESNVVIRFTDIYGNPSTSGAKIFAEVRSVLYGEPTVTRDNGDGSYSVLFVLAPGSYVLTFSVNGVEYDGPTLSLTLVAYCPRGSSLTQLQTCQLCAPNTFAPEETMLSCLDCPPLTNTNLTIGAMYQSQCICAAGAWREHTDTPGTCRVCPRGAYCLGGNAPPLPLAHWANAGGNFFARCPRPDACPGGPVQCASSYRGFLCKDCAAAHYVTSTGQCLNCPRSPTSLLGAFVGFLFILGCVVYLVVLVAYAQVSDIADAAMVRPGTMRLRKIPHAVSLALIAVQICALLGTSQLSWPTSASRVLSMLNYLTFDFNIFASDCSLKSFSARFIFSTLSPVVFFIALALAGASVNTVRLVSKRCATLPRLPMPSTMLAAVLLVGPIAYLPLIRITLMLFDCTKLVDGRWYLDADRKVQCFDKEWMRLLPLGIVAVLAYVIGIPGTIGVTLYRHRFSLYSDPHVIARYGTVYKLFRRQYYAMPLLQLLKRLALVLSSLFLSASPALLITAMLILISGLGALQAKRQPYFFTIYDEYELRVSVCLSGVLLSSVFFAVNNSANSVNSSLSFYVALIALFLSLSALVLYSFYYVVRDVNEILVDRRMYRTSKSSRRDHHRRLQRFMNEHLIDVEEPESLMTECLESLRRQSVISLGTVSAVWQPDDIDDDSGVSSTSETCIKSQPMPEPPLAMSAGVIDTAGSMCELTDVPPTSQSMGSVALGRRRPSSRVKVGPMQSESLPQTATRRAPSKMLPSGDSSVASSSGGGGGGGVGGGRVVSGGGVMTSDENGYIGDHGSTIESVELPTVIRPRVPYVSPAAPGSSARSTPRAGSRSASIVQRVPVPVAVRPRTNMRADASSGCSIESETV